MSYPPARHRTLVLTGSLRTGSVTSQIAQAALARSRPGHEVVLAAGLGLLPLFNEDLETEPALPAVAALRAQVASADSLLALSPVYNAGISAALKNALDWLSRPRDASPLIGKRATGLVVGYSSHGAEDHLEAVLKAVGAHTVVASTTVLNLRTLDVHRAAHDPLVEAAVGQALDALHAPDPVVGRR
ncbi:MULTISPECIES: NADPH-dependent FMN reductase [Streptacidiphilus]|uniref:NADPH-dependent FMN reductase n=1 Tax=Streptacidiphilus cavernicola TaxID=3342716 RepID=A0ABV6UXS5_9ACTN|nr:NADPH-dependent FMN reductase [Streptacidiphilus jeojiense]